MNDKKLFKIVDNNGNEKKFEILLIFKWMKTNKYYIVYTDNSENNGKLNVFANIFYPDDNSKFDLIQTQEEWNEIEKRLGDLENNE